MLIASIRLGTGRFLLSLCVLLTLSACKTDYYSWREKLTLTVETPLGVVTGYSITQLDYEYFVDKRIGGNSRSQKRVGEAVVVDLGRGRYLFALLPSNSRIAYGTFRAGRKRGDNSGDTMRRITESLGLAPEPIKREYWPKFVTFADINDPASVQLVDPDDLAASFGAGYGLQSVTLQIVEEPMTEGVVEGILGWFYTVKHLLPPSERPKFAKDLTPEQNISLHDFIDWRTQHERRKGDQ